MLEKKSKKFRIIHHNKAKSLKIKVPEGEVLSNMIKQEYDNEHFTKVVNENILKKYYQIKQNSMNFYNVVPEIPGSTKQKHSKYLSLANNIELSNFKNIYLTETQFSKYEKRVLANQLKSSFRPLELMYDINKNNNFS